MDDAQRLHFQQIANLVSIYEIKKEHFTPQI